MLKVCYVNDRVRTRDSPTETLCRSNEILQRRLILFQNFPEMTPMNTKLAATTSIVSAAKAVPHPNSDTIELFTHILSDFLTEQRVDMLVKSRGSEAKVLCLLLTASLQFNRHNIFK